MEEALGLLADLGDGGKVLAGGQSLGPLLNLRLVSPGVLVDVNRVPGLDTVGVDAGFLRLGALVRHRTLERSPEVRAASPLIAEAAAQIGHVAIRNRGTLGGSLAHADPAAELPATLVCLDGEVELRSAIGERVLGAAEFFTGPLTSATASDEMVVGARVPLPSATTGHAWLEFARRHGDFALVGVAARVTVDGLGCCSEARIVLAGVGGVPLSVPLSAEALVGERPTRETCAAAATLAPASVEPDSNAPADYDYRKRLVRVLVERALCLAAARAGVTA